MHGVIGRFASYRRDPLPEPTETTGLVVMSAQLKLGCRLLQLSLLHQGIRRFCLSPSDIGSGARMGSRKGPSITSKWG